jgi:hypothetical protein
MRYIAGTAIAVVGVWNLWLISIGVRAFWRAWKKGHPPKARGFPVLPLERQQGFDVLPPKDT